MRGVLVQEKDEPTYDLARIKVLFADPTRLTMRTGAIRGLVGLGLTNRALVAIIQSLGVADFDKSMTTYDDPALWQDVYLPVVDGDRLYVKFQRDPDNEIALVSFKEV